MYLNEAKLLRENFYNVIPNKYVHISIQISSRHSSGGSKQRHLTVPTRFMINRFLHWIAT